MRLITVTTRLWQHRRTALWVGVHLLALPAQAQAEPQPPSLIPATVFLLDPAHTRVHWEVRHFGTSTSRGRFDAVSGHLQLHASGTGEVSISVGTASVNTGVAPLDGVLRRSYLDSQEFPQAYFVASGWRWKADAPLEVRGELTLHGISRPLTLRAERLGCYTHPQLHREVCGADLQAELQRSDYGITDGLPFIGDTVRLQIQVEAVRQDGSR